MASAQIGFLPLEELQWVKEYWHFAKLVQAAKQEDAERKRQAAVAAAVALAAARPQPQPQRGSSAGWYPFGTAILPVVWQIGDVQLPLPARVPASERI